MAMRSRSRQLKSVAKIGLLPSLFNINEPILFGFPVIMNPVFTAVSLCSADKCLYRMVFNSAGYPRPRGGDAAMVDAFPLGAAWSANGSWKNLCMSLFAMFNAWMLYRPFFKVYERQLAETER